MSGPDAGGLSVSEWYFRYSASMRPTARTDGEVSPRVWILVWALGMAASIQLLIDIRRMSMPPPLPLRPPPDSRPRVNTARLSHALLDST